MSQRPRLLAAVPLALGLVAATLAVLFSPNATASPAPAPACSTTPTSGTKVIWVGLEARSYNLRVPAGLTGPAPLLLDMHGLGSNAVFQEVASGWTPYAEAKKFIVAYPAGSSWGQSWDLAENSGDVRFLKAVIKQIQSTYCVDPKRTYAGGGSYGGFMSQRLACDAEDLVAAIAPVITGPVAGNCSVSTPVSAAFFSSEDDPLFPAATVGRQAKNLWVAKNNCSTTVTPDPNPHGTIGEIHNGCDGGAQVSLRSYGGNLGHAYPSGAGLQDLHDKAWNFLMAHPKP